MNQTATDAKPRFISVDDHQRIAVDLPCAGCGFNMREQALDRSCPDCGLSLRKTLDAGRARVLPMDWVRQVHVGVRFLAASIPLLLAFGAGVFVWMGGVVLLTVGVPANQPSFKRLRGLILVSGLAAVGFWVLQIVLRFTAERASVAVLLPGLIASLMMGIHLGAVLRFAARFCGLAGWSAMHALGNVLALAGAILPMLLYVSLLVMAIRASYVLGGAPGWLDPFIAVVGVPTLLASLVLVVLLMVLWLGIAAQARDARRVAA